MIAIISVLYLSAVLYIGLHLLHWFNAFQSLSRGLRIFLVTVFGLCSLTPVLSFMLSEDYVFYKGLKLFSNVQLGILLYGGIVSLVLDIIALIGRIVLKKPLFSRNTLTKAVGLLSLVFVAAILVFGAVNATRIKTAAYSVSVDKKAGKISSLKLVAVSDTHFGYSNGAEWAKKVAEAVNREKPDLVLFLGDSFDNSFEALEEPDKIAAYLKSIQSVYGTFAVFGNHDTEGFFGGASGDGNFTAFFKKAGITLLQDESVLIDDSFYLVGREDANRAKSAGIPRKKTGELTKELNPLLPIIVLEHEPAEYDLLAASGADLCLSGHTHGGQVFPGNLLVKAFYENPAGVLKVRNMTAVTGTGTGFWGPPLRIGTDNEVLSVTVTFR